MVAPPDQSEKSHIKKDSYGYGESFKKTFSCFGKTYTILLFKNS